MFSIKIDSYLNPSSTSVRAYDIADEWKWVTITEKITHFYFKEQIQAIFP